VIDGNTCSLIGQSQITVPFQVPLDIAMHNDEVMLIQQVDTSVLALAEQSYEIRSDLRKQSLKERAIPENSVI
jgi:hypothetical protein